MTATGIPATEIAAVEVRLLIRGPTILASEVDMPERVPAEATAALLRRRVAASPLWIDVDGASMAPTIEGGARVLVVGGAQPRRGQVWAFVDATGAVVVHRARGRSGDRWWFRGDGNPGDDPPVPVSSLVGRVVAVESAAGRRRIGAADSLAGRLRLDVDTITRKITRVLGRNG